MNVGDTHDPPLEELHAHTVRKISVVSPELYIPRDLNIEHREIH
jgi:hypothetical protein